eukprot:CAMPEP_0181250036 /NCGR_PEP_ID=MMETSP1096-20121128/46097_1 /TAXON_ID=156174 ORGANISM="Chrysochromulina ericina, Strain CCMP281" /NCGR_SAMPLE_ID=MMETSP1096 /ASSEMBLY_ACC=CAM_ASM_000453 /LENGTH=80 /DNA_ID=CAMNT_0023347461 /DNA_START=299 /DNA_END=537 /DNA_ORIENTATION=+
MTPAMKGRMRMASPMITPGLRIFSASVMSSGANGGQGGVNGRHSCTCRAPDLLRISHVIHVGLEEFLWLRIAGDLGALRL